MGGKWLDMLKEIWPELALASFLYNPETSPHIAAGFYLKDAETAGRQLAVKMLPVPLHSPSHARCESGNQRHRSRRPSQLVNITLFQRHG
jgi:hypothetical protein